MENYKPTIGLEIHAELKTKTKMFCSCPNNPFNILPNTNVCPICLAHPGTLPTINEEAVKKVIMVGMALGGKISEITKFDRKNYFYPDLPKGYQISQYDKPLVVGGILNNIKIRRIHLEEDTGTLIHDDKSNESLVDFNRAGVPLMELVTEPDIRSAEEAKKFCEDLQLILRYLDVSEADMEKGEMRLEANVSINMGTKVEIKNINSFKSLYSAINYEIERQIYCLKKGEKIIQETRGWDDVLEKTFSQRSKEESHDYRYFPEPDLPQFETSFFDLEYIKNSLPELPQQKLERFDREYNLSNKQAEVLIKNKLIADFFEEAISELKLYIKDNQNKIDKNPINLVYNYLTSDLMGMLNEVKKDFVKSENDLILAGKIKAANFAKLIDLILEEKIGSRQAKDILKIMFETGNDPKEIMKQEGLETISDDNVLEEIIKIVFLENQEAINDYKKGKESVLQYLVGKTMAKLKGRGNPSLILQKIKDMI
ncbi:MAG: Asp-tRNA(Asn)/Glu-tRNA(Gln) amidotransferase subunit GatB [Patescibacteria group bacterium]|nr:Asp-tRNA(Asn)/Glu-tRNA(Gln) amidotransferase subunit GatB [Patescibacteria group bacterium]